MRTRIIVLEDDESSRRLLSMLLQVRGYEVISAAAPNSCPLYADLNAPCPHEYPCGDFLLTDNRMPRMTGLELIARQEQRGCKGIVRNKAVISGTWETHELETAEQLGCKTFSKPYRLVDILNWLNEREKTLAPDRKLARLDEL